ncbi:MAG TPA: CopG family transcriptional regulator [Steroidobacteraceae bacterium]|nr:CopG family transcriptional regulator [Steroidobacteraceae bacterium]
MIRTQISFDKALYERAKRAAKRRGVSLAELCRRSVAEVVGRDETAHPWMNFIGIIDGGADDSSSVDDVVYGRNAP